MIDRSGGRWDGVRDHLYTERGRYHMSCKQVSSLVLS